jgi:hypothetical protein
MAAALFELGESGELDGAADEGVLEMVELGPEAVVEVVAVVEELLDVGTAALMRLK